MKQIKLTQGKIALIDDEDFDYLNKFHWQAHRHGCGYNFWDTLFIRKW